MGLELGKGLFDGVEVGRVWRKETQFRTAIFDRLSNSFTLVAAEIVHDHDIAGAERRCQKLLDIGPEAVAIDRAVDDQRRVDPVMAQCGDEGGGFPVAMGDMRLQPLATPAAAMAARHIGLRPGLIDEDEAGRVKPRLFGQPLGPSLGDIRAGLFFSENGFF